MTAVAGRAGRIAAGAVALTALAALVGQYHASLERNGTALANLWVLARYFTILTNGLVVVVFGGVALKVARLDRPSLLGCAVLSILLVGIVYTALLHGTIVLSAADVVPNIVLHWVVPVAAPAWWLAFARKGRLSPGDPWRWALYPGAYAAYALARGRLDGIFAYLFIDAAAIGWERALLNCLLIGLGFLAAGSAFVRLDRALGRGAAI